MKKKFTALFLILVVLTSLCLSNIALASGESGISVDGQIIGGSSPDASRAMKTASDIPNLLQYTFTCSSTIIFIQTTNYGDVIDLFSGTITIGSRQKTFSFAAIPTGVHTYSVAFNLTKCSEGITITATAYDEGFSGSGTVTGSRNIPSNEINAWSYGGRASKQANIEYHFNKHGVETYNLDIRSYILDAISFRSQFPLGASGTPVPGRTPGVYRFKNSVNYIDLERPNSITNLIVSYGKLYS